MIHSEVNDRELVLVPGRKSRGSGNWDKDDYDVRLGDASGPVIGRNHAPLASTGSTAVVLDDNRAGATALSL